MLLAPLDTAACLYHAQPGASIASEGLSPVPLLLGSPAPMFTPDATIGDHWLYSPGQFASAAVPAADLNGDVSFAVRVRPRVAWPANFSMVLSVIEGPPAAPLKKFFLYQTTGPRWIARFFGDSWFDAKVESVTVASTGRTDTLVATWSGTDNTLRFYVNGTLEGTATAPGPRSASTQPGLGVAYPYSSGNSQNKLMRVAHFTRCLTPGEVVAISSDPWWTTDGPPPPPPPPGVVRVFLDGTEQPGAVVKVDGVTVEAPETGERVVEVDLA